jgi:hypothetical protein
MGKERKQIMNEHTEMTNKQKKQLAADEFKRKYQRYWLMYWGLFFVAALSFICGLVLPFMREDIVVRLTWGTLAVSLFYALGFLTVGEGAFNFWFDKITDSDPDNNTQKLIAGVMIALSGLVSLSTALATSYIIAWWIKIFDTFVSIPAWAQKYIAIIIPVMVIVNVAAGTMFKWVSDEAYSERENNARIREAKNRAIQAQAKARADYMEANAPILARQMGEIEAQDQLDALQAQINEKRSKRGQNPANTPTVSYAQDVGQLDYLRPPHGDRQHPDLLLARVPGAGQILQEWREYDNNKVNGNGAADPSRRRS